MDIYIYCVVTEHSHIYISRFQHRGGRGTRRIHFVNKANRCYKTHDGSSPMVTVKTERIPNCWDVIIVIIIIIIIKIWNDKNSYLLSAVEYRLLISGKRERAAGAEIKLKKKNQSEPKLVLQASAGNKKKGLLRRRRAERRSSQSYNRDFSKFKLHNCHLFGALKRKWRVAMYIVYR